MRLDHMRKTPSRRAAIPGPRQTPVTELRSEVQAAMAVLPVGQREILRMRLVEGLSADEVAARLSMTSPAVKVAQHRALEALRAHLKSR